MLSLVINYYLLRAKWQFFYEGEVATGRKEGRKAAAESES
jgi:hypothetical protein